uniref:Uncharacterized protein n=1 Tax=Cacopsylla melanoneura TaxID=428564 RepID=A0A8D9F8Q6_9HEMI
MKMKSIIQLHSLYHLQRLTISIHKPHNIQEPSNHQDLTCHLVRGIRQPHHLKGILHLLLDLKVTLPLKDTHRLLLPKVTLQHHLKAIHPQHLKVIPQLLHQTTKRQNHLAATHQQNLQHRSPQLLRQVIYHLAQVQEPQQVVQRPHQSNLVPNKQKNRPKSNARRLASTPIPTTAPSSTDVSIGMVTKDRGSQFTISTVQLEPYLTQH